MRADGKRFVLDVQHLGEQKRLAGLRELNVQGPDAGYHRRLAGRFTGDTGQKGAEVGIQSPAKTHPMLIGRQACPIDTVVSPDSRWCGRAGCYS